MPNLIDLIEDTFPANGDEGVPLLSNITITLSGTDYDDDSLIEGLFVEGPDTDQFIGPGLLSLQADQNVSQGDIDDFLQSPGYTGIVQGTTTVSGIAGNTVVTFDPELPLHALIEYTVNLSGVLDGGGSTIDGFATFSFKTGSGSIQEVPSDISTSILSASKVEASSLGAEDTLRVEKITPLDYSVQNPITLDEITVEFNKPIKTSSIPGNISVKTISVTDHPNATTKSKGDLAISTTVEGSKVKIKI